MFDLSNPLLVQITSSDPGRHWQKESLAAIDAPPDTETIPLPEARWSPTDRRTGVCGVVSPRVLALREGGFRMYYSQILPRSGFPQGANDYDNSTTRILSARSSDGRVWIPEAGVRLSPQAGGAGDFRVVSTEVGPCSTADGSLRMYYECAWGPQSEPNTIRSALSRDGGLTWEPESGIRFEVEGSNVSSPRICYLEDGRCRLYCHLRGQGIISAIADKVGLTFHREAGCRIAQDGKYDAFTAFAPEILRVQDLGYIMYYAGYATSNRAYILRAVSKNGLDWHKESNPVIRPGGGTCDDAKCTEMCVFPIPQSGTENPVYRMVYEACDGTANNERGVWRIASAISFS